MCDVEFGRGVPDSADVEGKDVTSKDMRTWPFSIANVNNTMNYFLPHS